MALSIRLPEELEARLEKLSKTTGRTKTYYIREAIEEYLADLEDHYLAQKRMKDYDPDENVSMTPRDSGPRQAHERHVPPGVAEALEAQKQAAIKASKK